MVSDSVAKLVSVFAQVVQTLAIIIAGGWALYIWSETVRPASATGIQASGEATSVWSDQAGACRGTFTLTMENVGIRQAKLGDVTYSIAPIPVERLKEGERFKLLRFVDPVEKPLGGALESLQGLYAPKEKRMKQIPFLFRPEKDTAYSIEVIFAEEPTSTIAMKWYAEVPNCRTARTHESRAAAP